VDAFLTAVVEIAQPLRLLMVASGVFAGLVIGVIPGVGGIFGLALLIPLTYSLDPYAAFALLLGMGSVTTTSDTIPAVLFGVPGTVGAAATVLDGHAMARKGEAARARRRLLGVAHRRSLRRAHSRCVDTDHESAGAQPDDAGLLRDQRVRNVDGGDAGGQPAD
jgi:TctA family transporter